MNRMKTISTSLILAAAAATVSADPVLLGNDHLDAVTAGNAPELAAAAAAAATGRLSITSTSTQTSIRAFTTRGIGNALSYLVSGGGTAIAGGAGGEDTTVSTSSSVSPGTDDFTVGRSIVSVHTGRTVSASVTAFVGYNRGLLRW